MKSPAASVFTPNRSEFAAHLFIGREGEDAREEVRVGSAVEHDHASSFRHGFALRGMVAERPPVAHNSFGDNLPLSLYERDT